MPTTEGSLIVSEEEIEELSRLGGDLVEAVELIRGKLERYCDEGGDSPAALADLGAIWKVRDRVRMDVEALEEGARMLDAWLTVLSVGGSIPTYYASDYWARRGRKEAHDD